jgi:hypothetical protein
MSRDEPGAPGGPGEAAEAGSPDVRGGQSRLERRYQRLLACYPADHRRAHGQEMLDVLMTGAHAGQRSPGLVESADLIRGAVRVRIRPGASADPGWREALALLVWYIVIAATGPGTSVYDPPAALTFYFFLFGLEAVALAASPGPRRGLQLLTWRRSPLLIVAGVAAATVQTSWGFPGGWGHEVIAVAGIIAIVILAAWMALASRTSRRVLVLLTVPAYCLAAPLLIGGAPLRTVTVAPTLLVDLPPLVILGLAVTAARRRGAGRPTG